METNALRLLAEVKAQLADYHIPHAEEYEANVMTFLNLCPDDDILEDVKVVWDNDGDFFFSWDTDNLDCIFHIGLDAIGWRIGAGINNHKIDEECLLEGIGGDKIVDNDFYAAAITRNLTKVITLLMTGIGMEMPNFKESLFSLVLTNILIGNQ